MKYFTSLILLILLTIEGISAQSTLFTNIKIFDGTANKLIEGKDVLVENNLITKIAANIIAPQADVTVIDGKGMTLMPGLIESHTHLNLQYMIGGYETMENRDWQEIGAMASFAASSLLMDGFTTIRDCGTLQGGMRTAIDGGFSTHSINNNSDFFF